MLVSLAARLGPLAVLPRFSVHRRDIHKTMHALLRPRREATEMTTNPADRSARIAEIAERHEKATPGEWLPAQDGEYRYASIKGEERPGHKGDGSHRTMPPPGVRFTGENADFIAHAHQDIPYLLAALSTADAERREMVGLMRATADYLDALEANMLRNDADMIMDSCEAPEDVALKLRQAADRAEGK